MNIGIIRRGFGDGYERRSLIIVIPAKRVGEVSEQQTKYITRGAQEYVERVAGHR